MVQAQLHQNFYETGTVNYFNDGSTNISVGDVVVAGSLVGISQRGIPAGEVGALTLGGVFDMTKATGAISVGTVVYWDAAAKNVTTTATGNAAVGIAVEAAQSADSTARVLLNVRV